MRVSIPRFSSAVKCGKLRTSPAVLACTLVLGGCGAGRAEAPIAERAGSGPAASEADHLCTRIRDIAERAHSTVGVAVALLETEVVCLHSGGERLPMQSVFKLPLAMAVLSEVDGGTLGLDQRVRVEPSDFVSRPQHSPIRDANPQGIELSVSELVRAAVSTSDGTAADVLLGLIGGPERVTHYLRGIGVEGMVVAVTEKEMGRDRSAQYRNWATPEGALELLRALHEARGLSAASHALLLRFLTETPTGPNRIKGMLPERTVVAHKTGTSGTVDGRTAATNNIGIVSLPDGRQLAVAVFVADSPCDAATRESVIAEIARTAYDHWKAPGR